MPTASRQPTAPRAQQVERMARELGFALTGIAPAGPSEHADAVRAWLNAGRHGQMDYMARDVEQRLDPRVLVPGARAVICVGDRYAESGKGYRVLGVGCSEENRAGDSASSAPYTLNPKPYTLPAATGRVARYAWGDDYHRVMKKRLHALADQLRELWPGHEYRTTVDTAPILDREQAARAGLGWIGKNTMLIHPTEGSWFVLGEIVTTLPLETAADRGQLPTADHCGTCTRCIDACPTHCIEPRRIDASRCISYLTIEHKGEIDPSLHEAMGDWIAGCDVCQEVCPFNEGPRDQGAEGPSAYRPRPPAPAIPLLQLLNWNEDERRSVLVRSALKRIKLEQFKRNALIAAGNYLAKQDDPALRRRIEEIALDTDEHELVRATARQVLLHLTSRS